MSLNYQTLTGLSILDNIDYLNCKSITAQEITDTGLNRNQPIATNTTGKLVSQPLTDGQLIIGNTATSSYNASTLTAGSSNQVITNGAGSITVDISRNLSLDSVNTTYWVNPTMTQAQIQAVLDNLNCQQVIFNNGTYNIGCLNIRRGNIVLEGNMSKLFMPNGTNNPNILVGDKTANPPTTRYQNIVIRNFRMDGNQANQTSETMSGYAWIYNNCITINKCSNVIVENCFLYNSISGGMTITYQSNNIKFLNCTAMSNKFDGYTAYGSTNIIFKGCYATAHTNGAGASFDTNTQYMTFDGCVFTNNQLGVFGRDSYDIVFSGCVISANTGGGMFLSGYSDIVSDRGPDRWVITGNNINNNAGYGLFMQSCNHFSITGNTISGNYGDGVSFNNDTVGNSAGTCSYNNVSGNVITLNGNSGFYNGSFNDYSSGARSNYLSFNIIKNNSGTFQIRGDLTAWSQEDDTQLNTQQLVLHNSSGNYANINASGSGNCTFTFPSSNGGGGTILQTDGSGNSTWATLSTGIMQSGGAILNNIMLSNSSGSIKFDTVETPQFSTVFLRNPAGSSKGVNLSAIGGTGNWNMKLPINAGSSGNLLITDGTGTTSWTGSPSLDSLTLNNSGNTTVLNGGGSGSTSWTFPSTTGASNNILTTNGSGITSWTASPSLNSLTLNNSGYTTVLNGGGSGSTTITLPSTSGSSGQALITDGAGNTSWGSVLTTTADNFTVGTGAGGTGTLTLVQGSYSCNITNSSYATATTTFTLPPTNGSSGQVLKLNSLGTYWGDVSNSMSFQIGDGTTAGSGWLEYDGPYSSSGSGIVSGGSAQSLPANPRGYFKMYIAGVGNVAVPFYNCLF